MSSEANSALEEIGSLLQQGQKDQALDLARSQIASAVASGEADRVALAWTNLAQVQGALGDLAEASKALEKAVLAIPGSDDSPELALPRFRCLLGLGQVLVRLERKGRARETLERALVAANALGGELLPRHQAMVAIPLGWLLLDAGDADRAIPTLEAASLTLCEGEQDHPNQVQALVLLANGRVRKGEEHALLPNQVPKDFPLPMLAQGLAAHIQQLAEQASAGRLDAKIPRDLAKWSSEWLSRVAGKESRITPDVFGLLAALEGMCNRHDHQVEALERAEKLYRQRGDKSFSARAARARAMILAEKGNLELAEPVLRASLAEARELDDADLISESAQALAQVLHVRGNQAECESLLTEAIAKADQVENLDMGAMAALSLGLVMAHTGRLAQAQPLFKKAIERIPRDSQLHQVAQVHITANQEGRPCPCDPAFQAQQQQAQARAQMPTGQSSAYTEMMKQVLPEDLFKKLEAVMAKAPAPGSPGMDPETSRMLQELEGRTMKRLEGMMGMLKTPPSSNG